MLARGVLRLPPNCTGEHCSPLRILFRQCFTIITILRYCKIMVHRRGGFHIRPGNFMQPPTCKEGSNPLPTNLHKRHPTRQMPPAPKKSLTKQKSVTCGYRLRFKRKIAYSAWIAPVGQTPSQAPQSTQEAASTTALSSMLIAPTGQVSTHAPQATHSLETV